MNRFQQKEAIECGIIYLKDGSQRLAYQKTL